MNPHESGDVECTNKCKISEATCKRQCPCYEDCPNGCPCPGWCGKLPCYDIFGEEKVCCENKCETIRDECMDACDPINEFCKDDCQYAFADCWDSCPCHTVCKEGCPCNNENSIDNIDCCGEFDWIQPPNNTECTLLWEPEMLACRDHCSALTQVCLSDCGDLEDEDEAAQCRADCRETQLADCLVRCPCYDECPEGCPCPYYSDFPNFCPNKLPDARCVKDHEEQMLLCHEYCHDSNHECVMACPSYNGTEELPDYYDDLIMFDDYNYDNGNWTNGTCLDLCRINAIECPLDCPCHENCPNGCPCGYISPDCQVDSDDIQPKFPADPDKIWCVDDEPPEDSEDPACNALWDDEREECNDYCSFVESGCLNRCNNDFDKPEDINDCQTLCNAGHACCIEDCPCNRNCPHGCPCTNVACPGGTCVCPEIPVNQTCVEKWGQFAKRCDFDCLDAGYDCIDQNCTGIEDEQEQHDCYDMCKNEELECIYDCPCNRDCPNGCDIGDCPSWDKYCPVTTSIEIVTTPVTTTGYWTSTSGGTSGAWPEETVPTTTALTTTTASGPIGPEAPDLEKPVNGSTILILSDEKAMLHSWPIGTDKSQAWFYSLRSSMNDHNAVFDNADYWVKDACSVQFKGESYLIGGAYSCAGGNENCEHINVQKSVVKLSKEKCGFEVVWDGHKNKLPFDMKAHTCARFNKRIGNTGSNWQERVMMCSPDNAADDTANDKVEIERYCWSTLSMAAGEMYWEREPSLNTQHLHGSMIQHKGKLVIVGGNGDWQNQDGQESINSVEYYNQNGIQNEEGSFGKWNLGTNYPIYVQESSIISTGNHLYVFGGLVYDDVYDEWEDSAKFNTKLCFKNVDPAAMEPWVQHDSLLLPRANHASIILEEQLYHIAGYAKCKPDWTAEGACYEENDEGKTQMNGRRVEKWETIELEAGENKKVESGDELFNFISPEVLIVEEAWYKEKCSVKL